MKVMFNILLGCYAVTNILKRTVERKITVLEMVTLQAFRLSGQ
jgi:hypothetical protein